MAQNNLDILGPGRIARYLLGSRSNGPILCRQSGKRFVESYIICDRVEDRHIHYSAKALPDLVGNSVECWLPVRKVASLLLS